jgi:non-ribosomal peptide synthetase component E (peptide arylation enzyme)
MAADPHCSATLREEARKKLAIGDEEQYLLYKDLANKIDEVASRYEHSKLIEMAEELEERKRKRNDGRYI